MAKGTAGRVKQIMGGVVDVEFPPEQLPEIYGAVEVPREDEKALVLEVQEQKRLYNLDLDENSGSLFCFFILCQHFFLFFSKS